LGSPGGMFDFTFSSPIALSASTVYWLVTSRSSYADVNVQLCGTVGSGGGNQAHSSTGATGSWTGSSASSFDTATDVVEGSPPPPPATTTEATRTPVDSANQDLFYGVLLFMVGFWGTVWFFKKTK